MNGAQDQCFGLLCGQVPAIHLSQYVKVEPLLEVSSASRYETKVMSGEIQGLKEQVIRLENNNIG